MKTCRICEATKPLDDFPPNRGGRLNTCRVCHAADWRRRHASKPPRISLAISDRRLINLINLRAAESPESDDWHWRYNGPPGSATAGGQLYVYQRVADLTLGHQLPEPIEFWCWDQYPWCVNIDHAVPHSELQLAHFSEFLDEGNGEEGTGAIVGMRVVSTLDHERNNSRTSHDYQQLARLQSDWASDWYDASDSPATRYLKEHGLNDRGEPFKRRSRG